MVHAEKRYMLVEIENTDDYKKSPNNNLEIFMYNNKLAVNVDEFADLMGIGRENAMRLIEQKKNPVPHKRAGNRIIISFPALVKWLENWTGAN